MKMRVIAGSLKGRMVAIPERDSTFRPTRERIRESLAAILAPRLYGASVADVCAGSGAIGFELLSRGAARVVFVENNRFRCKRIAEHAERFGRAAACRIVQHDAATFAGSCTERFDIIYYDPPYDDTALAAVALSLFALLADNGVLVWERRSSAAPLQTPPTLPSAAIRTYGETALCFFSAGSDNEMQKETTAEHGTS
jgi:16S rRNA (guanine966-N2)-methyltransferase